MMAAAFVELIIASIVDYHYCLKHSHFYPDTCEQTAGGEGGLGSPKKALSRVTDYRFSYTTLPISKYFLPLPK